MAEQQKQTPPPAEWFVEVVAEGIAKLYVLRLESAPAADTLDGVEMVWVEALWYSGKVWEEHLDRNRLRQAFVHLVQTVTRWPAPRTLMDHLPARAKPRELPAPPPTPEDRARAEAQLAKLREMMKDIKTGGSHGA